MYDVVVVGARCAGAAAARLLAAAGHRVLLVDRARFPSDTLSTHYILPAGVKLLSDWGLLDWMTTSGCPPVDHFLQDLAGERITGQLSTIDNTAFAYAPRRHLLDAMLVEAAVAAGAEFADRHRLEGLLWDDDRVAGVRCRLPDGRRIDERARLVIGADGVRSTVADLVNARIYDDQPSKTCAYYTYWSGVPGTTGTGPYPHTELYMRDRRAIGAVATHDGLALIGAYFPQRDFLRVRTEAMSAYQAAVRTAAPDLYDRMTAGHRVERLYGVGRQPNFFRDASGPGWVLLGDAGHHQDSVTAWGITNAFRQARLLATLLPAHLDDRSRLDEALHEFARRRDAVLRPTYDTALRVAELAVTPDAMAFSRLIRSSRDLTTLYIAVKGGLRPREDLTAAIRHHYATEPVEA
ncbi:MAG: FAD-dependent oxidoreductase [Saccharothrix sp.]|nr:FAD-dependent oxidoreductase [Saccharothrix sp.]